MAPATSETVDGPRKRKHTTGNLNNSEIAHMDQQAELQCQQAAKKQKGALVPPASTSTTATAITLASGSQCQSSVEMEEVEDKDVYTPCAGLHNSLQILELADGSNNDDKELPAVINVVSSATPSDANITMVDNSNDNKESCAGDWEDEDAPETAEEELGTIFFLVISSSLGTNLDHCSSTLPRLNCTHLCFLQRKSEDRDCERLPMLHLPVHSNKLPWR